VAQLTEAENSGEKVADVLILQRLVAKIPWGHNILLMEKVKNLQDRSWYMEKTVENGWGRDTLAQ